MKTALLLVACCGSLSSLTAAEGTTAFNAMKSLPPEAAAHLAMIDGHDGAPSPERWHFLIQDPTAENGLREYVVTEKQVVADRQVSQFATQLTPADVVGKSAVKIDSDTVTRLARIYGAVNELPVSSINYRMQRDPVTDRPVWSAVCVDEQGAPLGTLVVDGADGRVVTHDGFALEPPASAIKPLSKREFADASAAAENKGRIARRSPTAGGFRPSAPPPPVMEGPQEDDRDIEVHRAEPVYRERRERIELPNPIRDVRNLIHRILPF